MASQAQRVVAVVHVGGSEQTYSELHTVRAVFHDFAELPFEGNQLTVSPAFECHGYEWKVHLYPGGKGASNEETPHVSIFLSCISAAKGGAKAKASFKIRIPSAGVTKQHRKGSNFQRGQWGWPDFCPRADVLASLTDGNLIVEVDIGVALDKPPMKTPPNTVIADMLDMLESADAETSDVTFQVQVGEEKETFHAHSNILRARCSTLADLAEDYTNDGPIPIDGVDDELFWYLLCFVYGGKIPNPEYLAANALTLIRAADRFGCIGLKLVAEAKLASTGINAENAADLVLFADGNNCAVLKEAAMDFFVVNTEAVMESDGYARVEESPDIVSQLMKYLIEKKKGHAPPNTTVVATVQGSTDSSEGANNRKAELSVRGTLEVINKGLEATFKNSVLLLKITVVIVAWMAVVALVGIIVYFVWMIYQSS